MKIAGFGFRKGAGVESLLAALDAAGGALGLTAIATVAQKAEARAMQELAARLDLPLIAVPKAALARVEVVTQSEKSVEMYGTGSVSEAAALVALGREAQITTPRALSPDTMATCAIAESCRDRTGPTCPRPQNDGTPSGFRKGQA